MTVMGYRACTVKTLLPVPTKFPRQFDAAIVCCGIHHLVTDLDTAMANIATR
jgi:hypothetical protein